MTDDDLLAGYMGPVSLQSQLSKGYNGMVSLFGRDFLPDSIMLVNRKSPDRDLDEHADERGYTASQTDEHQRNQKDDRLPEGLRQMWHLSGRGSLNGALPKFPQEVGRTVVLFYTEPGDTVVDPFAGHNSRMDLVVKAGRNYIGCDLCREFMDFNRQRADKLRKRFPNLNITLHRCDSREQPIADEVGDFTITSPPYFDIEYYGDEDEQLGRSTTYPEFMDGMEKVLEENFRTLKPGAYSTWFVNDFRRDGRFHYYHSDLMRRGERVGFLPHDLMIVDLGRSVRDCFLNQAKQLKILPKRHEYCVVMRKPN